MRITEIYKSIQGETRYSGLPCTLVRTTGCDLRCGYCDTEYAFYGGCELSVDEVLAEVRRLDTPLVLLTGGEPLLQRDLPELARRILAEGREVMVETSGSRDVSVLPAGVVRIVDVKTPGSGEVAKMRWENLALLGACDAVKFVLVDEADYRFAAAVIAEHRLADRTEVLLSPAHDTLAPADLVAWMLRDGLRARLNLQLHKYVWSKEARGV